MFAVEITFTDYINKKTTREIDTRRYRTVTGAARRARFFTWTTRPNGGDATERSIGNVIRLVGD